MRLPFVRDLFALAGLYDFAVGSIVLLAYHSIYWRLGVPLASQPPYVYFAGSVLCIFGIGFWFVARAPERNRDIITMGVLLKLAYSGAVLVNCAHARIAPVWIVAVGIDLTFVAGFLAARHAIAVAATGGRPARMGYAFFAVSELCEDHPQTLAIIGRDRDQERCDVHAVDPQRRGAIGARRNRPQATNNASAETTMCRPMTFTSPREI